MHGVKGESEIEKWKHKCDAMDILGVIVRPRAEAWGEDVDVNPTTLLLVDAFRNMDEHYKYTKRETDFEDEGTDAVTVGGVLEEQYNASVDPTS